ncbi:MAG TPA: SMC-Scp complex subunit ScpB [Nitrospiria bacterium]|nr:SMC-Scp complex subunit ScpB [Nitrospiria bacterium]
MEEHELTAVLEAILFVSGEPMSLEELSEVLEGTEAERIRQALDHLRQNYESAGRGLQIVEVAGGYRIVTRSECAPWIRSLEKIKTATRLSRSGLETLAIVAYKQPVTRGEIEAIRGVDSAYVLKTLLERRILKITGRREGLGRPILYGTTREFLQYFGLKDLSELPALKEFKEVAETLPEHEPIHEPASGVSH